MGDRDLRNRRRAGGRVLREGRTTLSFGGRQAALVEEPRRVPRSVGHGCLHGDRREPRDPELRRGRGGVVDGVRQDDRQRGVADAANRAGTRWVEYARTCEGRRHAGTRAQRREVRNGLRPSHGKRIVALQELQRAGRADRRPRSRGTGVRGERTAGRYLRGAVGGARRCDEDSYGLAHAAEKWAGPAVANSGRAFPGRDEHDGDGDLLRCPDWESPLVGPSEGFVHIVAGGGGTPGVLPEQCWRNDGDRTRARS